MAENERRLSAACVNPARTTRRSARKAACAHQKAAIVTEKIRKNIEQLSKHLVAHNAYMQKLGVSLGTTVGHFNTTYKELGKIDRDIVKITDTSPSVEPLALERPNLDES